MNLSWVPVTPGQIHPGDIVRVRPNAFSGELGQIHNGRIAEVINVKYGDVIVRSIDHKKPALDGSHYPPQHLETPK